MDQIKLIKNVFTIIFELNFFFHPLTHIYEVTSPDTVAFYSPPFSWPLFFLVLVRWSLQQQ